MSDFEFIFMADCQLGAYATFSGMTDDDVIAYAAKDMRVEAAPFVRGFEWDAARYREAIRAANHIRPDFVVMGGDMVDDPGDEAQLEEVLRITAMLDSDIPMRWVPGNHDVGADTVVPTAASIHDYRQAFGPDYYAFDFGPVRFVVMNTVVLDHPEEVPDELAEQFDFLTTTLGTAADDGQTVVLLGHHPLFLAEPTEDDSYWNLPLERRRLILDLIEQHRIPLGLAGHWHRNSIAHHGDFEMVTTGAVGYPLGKDPSGFRVVTVDRAGFSHEYVPLEKLS